MPVRKLISIVLLCLSIPSLIAAPAFGGDNDLSFTVGVKGWESSWTTWRPVGVGYDNGSVTISQELNSDTRFVLIPQASLRYANFFAAASYLAPETYPLTGNIDSQTYVSGRRTELDVNGGYYVLQGLALTVGYKQIRQDYGAGELVWSGPTIGVAGSAPLGSSNLAVYGTFGFGLLKLRLPLDSPDTAANQNSFHADYAVGELGFSYGISVDTLVKFIRLTIGYRAQVLSTLDYALQGANGSVTKQTQHDYTQGPTAGFSGSF